MAVNEDIRRRLLHEIEEAQRTGVRPVAQVGPILSWKAGDRDIIQIGHNAAWCQECGSLMLAPLDPDIPPELDYAAHSLSEWMPTFRCFTCYDATRGEECCECGKDISEGPSYPEPWPRKVCWSCFSGPPSKGELPFEK